MDPAEQPKLLLQVSTLQRQHEADKADEVQHEADETVVRRKWRQLRVGEYDVLKQVGCRRLTQILTRNAMFTLK